VRCGRCGRAYIGMSARGNGGTYHYYACTGRQKYGPKACRGERLPQDRLEQAVLRQLAGIYRDGTLIEHAIAKAEANAKRQRPALEQRIASIGAEITRLEQSRERYYEAFERGTLSAERCNERLSRLQARLTDLRGQHAELDESTPDEGTHAPTRAELATIADHLDQLIANAEPQQAKALLRHLIAELKVNSRAKIQPTYRVITETVCATSEKVERAGIEPVTTGLQSRNPRRIAANVTARTRMKCGLASTRPHTAKQSAFPRSSPTGCEPRAACFATIASDDNVHG
jgi:site-specific DNA recombinase